MPPPRRVRLDGDDPYLVVAADKGTATFSDIANALAVEQRLLAGRRLRLGRLGRLRPQEDGHHRARRLGGGEAPFPRDEHRHPDDAVPRHRRRRHVGRRVRQRHAAVAPDPAASPPSTIATSSSIPTPDPEASWAGAQAAVRPAAFELAGLQPRADLRGRRRLQPRRRKASRSRCRCSSCSARRSKPPRPPRSSGCC